MNNLIIFVKNPIKGKVKTRLAASLGDDIALEIYHQLIAYTFNITNHILCRKYIFFSDFIDNIGEGEAYQKRLQKGSDLGVRMDNAISEIITVDKSKVILIGTDCPAITTEIIEIAFYLLDINDVVVGPSVDGGYYLIGMKRSIPEIFRDIQWSTDSVLAETLDKLEQLKLKYVQLPVLNDIDTKDDLVTSLNAIVANP